MWIELHDNLPDHPKIVQLSVLVRMDRDLARAKVERLWLWALTNRISGVLTHNDVPLLADVMRLKGSAQKMVDALTACGLLDVVPDGYLIHDWDEHVSMLADARERKRAQTRERVKRYRNAQQTSANDGQRAEERNACNALQERYTASACNAGNAATVPNRTVYDHDIDPTVLPVRAREEEALPVDNLWITSAREEIRQGFVRVTGAEPSPAELDVLTMQTGASGGQTVDMVLLAVGKALLYGAHNVTPYACRVLDKWRKMGVFTPEAAEEAEGKA